MRRDLNLRVRQFVANDGADARMNERGVWAVTGLDVVKRSFVIAFLAHHGANERDVAHHTRRLLQTCGKIDAFDRC